MANKEGSFWVDEEEGVLIVRDISGNEDKYVIEEQLEVEGNQYLILIPEEMADDEEAEAFVLKIVSEGEQEILSIVDDESEFEKVKESYMAVD
ncbi:MAG: DUF1292 domain-containing protein [Halanaerobiaceae bacterium]